MRFGKRNRDYKSWYFISIISSYLKYFTMAFIFKYTSYTQTSVLSNCWVTVSFCLSGIPALVISSSLMTLNFSYIKTTPTSYFQQEPFPCSPGSHIEVPPWLGMVHGHLTFNTSKIEISISSPHSHPKSLLSVFSNKMISLSTL